MISVSSYNYEAGLKLVKYLRNDAVVVYECLWVSMSVYECPQVSECLWVFRFVNIYIYYLNIKNIAFSLPKRAPEPQKKI